MLGNLRSVRKASSFYESRRRDSDRDRDRDYSNQDRYGRDRDREYRHRSRSRSPPPRLPSPPPVFVPHPPEPPRHRPSSHTFRSETHLQRVETTASIITEQVPAEPTGEGALKLAQMRKDFTNIYFDGYIFPPHLKRIPSGVEGTMHDYAHDIYTQYRDCVKAAEKASKVAFERAKALEKMETELA